MKSETKRFLLGGLLALICAQILYGVLMLSALQRQYERPLVQVNSLLCQNIADHLALLVRVGKSLRPQTVDRFLAPYVDRTQAADIVVTDASGQAISRLRGVGPEHISTPHDAAELNGRLRKFSDSRHIWISSPVLDRKGEEAGHVHLGLDKAALNARVISAGSSLIWLFLAVTAGEGLFLALLLRLLAAPRRRNADAEGDKPSGLRLRLCFMLPLVLGQIVFLALLYSPLERLYQTELHITGRQIATQLTWDLERLSGLGLPVSRIESMESWLMSRQELVDSIGIAVYDEGHRLKCAASANRRFEPAEWESVSAAGQRSSIDMASPLDRSFAGTVDVVMDKEAITSDLLSVLLDNLTLTIVAALFLSELLYLLLMGNGGSVSPVSMPGFMRPVIFACLFGTELSMSYVPIRIGELGLDLFGLAPELVSGLPISCELFCTALGMFIGGFWSQRSGWRPMLLAGIALAFAGSLASWLSPGPLPFILSRGLSGLGYGFMNLSAQVFVISRSSVHERAHNLAFMFAGLYAGTLCGSALGGLIADRLGYAAVFPASAITLLCLAVLLLRQLPDECWMRNTQKITRLRLGELASFLTDRRMAALLAFFIVPNALLTVCLFQYFIPLSLSQAGTSAASIGRVFLLYCIIVMFAGPLFGRMMDRTRSMVMPLFLAQLLCSACVAALLFFDGLTAAALSVAILGVNTSIAANGQGPYALSLPAAVELGQERTIGVYNVAMRIGQVLGPLSLGAMISLWNVRTGLGLLAAFMLASAVLFLLLSWKLGPKDGAGA